MAYQLAQLNIAQFRKPMDDPINKDFVDNLDRVNAEAEAQPGFVWRLVGGGNDATDIEVFDNPNMLINLSVWKNIESLSAFVYRNLVHRKIMRRRQEWFAEVEVSLVLWWIKQDHVPGVDEALQRLARLKKQGPTVQAFNFKHPFPPPADNERA